MINQLSVFHLEHTEGAPIPKLSHNFKLWKTCLRSLYIGMDDHSHAHFKGVEAYEFLLQIICGLHSPMIGETEIMAQFKAFMAEFPDAITPKISNSLIKDAKKLRTNYLKDYGSQSYGSYTLKSSKSKKHIILYGAGGLVREILPIISGFNGEIVVKCRNPLKSTDLARRFPHIRIENIKEPISYNNSLVVIAAPIESETLNLQINQCFKGSHVLDMRSVKDGPSLVLNPDLTYKTLENIFAEIQSTQKVLELTSHQMKKEIKSLSLKWSKTAQVRPFGWEDLCC